MIRTIRIKIAMPKCPHCKEFIEKKLIVPEVDKFKVGRYEAKGTLCEFLYDDKKHVTIDNIKLEKLIKLKIQELGYETK